MYNKTNGDWFRVQHNGMSPLGIIVARGLRPWATMIPRGDIPLCCTLNQSPFVYSGGVVYAYPHPSNSPGPYSYKCNLLPTRTRSCPFLHCPYTGLYDHLRLQSRFSAGVLGSDVLG